MRVPRRSAAWLLVHADSAALLLRSDLGAAARSDRHPRRGSTARLRRSHGPRRRGLFIDRRTRASGPGSPDRARGAEFRPERRAPPRSRRTRPRRSTALGHRRRSTGAHGESPRPGAARRAHDRRPRAQRARRGPPHRRVPSVSGDGGRMTTRRAHDDGSSPGCATSSAGACPTRATLRTFSEDVFYELVEANRLLMPIEHVTGWLCRGRDPDGRGDLHRPIRALPSGRHVAHHAQVLRPRPKDSDRLR